MSRKPELGDEPIEKQHVEDMNAVAGGLDEIFNGQRGGPGRKYGFVLLVFPFGETEGRCNYISNGANREDVEKLLYEQAERFRKDREKKT
jgi:hypothetical protein